MMNTSYDFKKVEPKILKFWKEDKTWENLRKRGKKKFYFLDGPPYTSGRVHLGTAWNKSLKDIILRYKRMQGFNVWDRAGYDMHGMPTEQATMKELGIEKKSEIDEMGVERFVKECRNIAIRNMKQMNKDFMRLGVWMDFENAYMPIKPEYIEGEWWLIKKAHENKRLYLGEKTMTWCSKCGTALAKHELEYEKLNDSSIFMKFRLVGTENEYLIIWTTTPWTIPFNLGVMVNPDIRYVKAKVGDETWIMAEDLADDVCNAAEKEYEIIESMDGKDLKGLKYIHPLKEELKEQFDLQESDKVHSVVLSSEYVTTDAGSGLVHMAPGCGPEDYEVGHREGIRPFNEVNEEGIFKDTMGVFSGWKAKKDDQKFIDYFEKKGAVVAVNKLNHDYAHCWRCKSPVIYRTTKQWFFRVEDLKENMRELNKDIKWVPDHAGSRNFDSWLENLRDNGITRQRYWGTPLPVWKCKDCERYEVIGSRKDLEKFTKKIPDDLHKPFIDEVEWDCECGGRMRREPDVLDVWIDSGSASWNCLDYPHKKELFEEMYPADFILEGIDQIRGWFNLLFVASMVSMNRPSFKAVYMHGFVQDSQGRKMSKSLGNYILPEEVVDKYGADSFRYYMCGATNPGLDINYNFDDLKIKHKNLGILWNIANLIIDHAKSNGLKPGKTDEKDLEIAERYILSKTNSSIKRLTEVLDNYRINEAPWIAEELFLELSRTYIQLVRDKMSTGSKKEKQLVLDVMHSVMMTILKLFAPVCPMITEELYSRLGFEDKKESIHGCRWPKPDENMIDKQLESDFEIAKDIIQGILNGREKIQMGQRWPLLEVTVETIDDHIKESAERMKDVICTQTNVKKLNITEKMNDIKETIKANIGEMGKSFGAKKDTIIERVLAMDFDVLQKELDENGHKVKIDGEEFLVEKKHIIVEKDMPEHLHEVEMKHLNLYLDKTRNKELDSEGYAREVMRRVQQLRKEMSLKKNDKIRLVVEADQSLMLEPWKDDIQKKCGAVDLEFGKKHHKNKKDEKIKGHKIKISALHIKD